MISHYFHLSNLGMGMSGSDYLVKAYVFGLAERGRAAVVTDLSAETLAQAEQLKRDGDIGETGLHTVLRNWLAGQSARRSSRRWRPFQQKRKEDD